VYQCGGSRSDAAAAEHRVYARERRRLKGHHAHQDWLLPPRPSRPQAVLLFSQGDLCLLLHQMASETRETRQRCAHHSRSNKESSGTVTLAGSDVVGRICPDDRTEFRNAQRWAAKSRRYWYRSMKRLLCDGQRY
jgi:hypothetical protein